MDEAKHLLNQNTDLLSKHLSETILEDLGKHRIEYDLEEIKDSFGPVEKSYAAVRYLEVPKDVTVHVIDTEDQVSKLDLFLES